MKTSTKLFIAFGFTFALMVGFLIGISINYPKVDESLASGTITKLNNYKKTLDTKSEIQIKNELISDTSKLKSLQNYLKFYYMTTAKMAGDIRFSLDEANAVESFKNLHKKEIENISGYEKTLSAARTDLLIALRACQNPDKTDPVMLKEFLNQANNVVAQLSFRNSTVLEFIDVLAAYINENKNDKLQGLRRAHDLLTYNEINSAVMTRNKPVLMSFNKKGYLSEVKNQKFVNDKALSAMIEQDLGKLVILDKAVLNSDTEKLGLMDSEKLGQELTDSEKLGASFTDSEKLGIIYTDSEKLGFVFDSEKLGIIYTDSEKLGTIIFI